MIFERTFDYSLVRNIVTDPKVYPHVCDDGSPPAAEYRPIESESVWYVLAFDGCRLLGLFMLHPHNSVCWEIHTCLLPEAWGEKAKQAGRGIVPWVWENMPCRRIVTNVPAYNRLALRFAERAGMKRCGVNEKSFLKGGRLHDQIMLGLSPVEE